jgi:glycosyltransferase involved in cell wall biosynthesis
MNEPHDKISVLLPVHALPWHRQGGLERATWALAKGLAARGHGITLLTTPCPDWSPEEYGLERAQRHDDPDELYYKSTDDLITVFELPAKPAHPTPGFWRQVRDAVHSEKFHLAISGMNQAILAIDTAAMFVSNQPFILQLHGTLFSETSLHRGFRQHRDLFPLLWSIWRYKARLLTWPIFGRMLRRAEAIITDSEFISQELPGHLLRRNKGEHVHEIPLALEPDWSGQLADAGRRNIEQQADAEFNDKNPLRVLTVGRLSRMKGHETVAAALNTFYQKTGAPFVWEVAGPWPDVTSDLPQLSQLLQSAPPDSIKQLGLLSNDELVQAYGRAHYFLNMEYNQPAFGLVALEALTAGAVPLVSNRGALPEVLSDDAIHVTKPGDLAIFSKNDVAPGIVVPAGDDRLLADSLESLYQHGVSGWQAMAEAAMQSAERFSFDAYLSEMEAVLRYYAI